MFLFFLLLGSRRYGNNGSYLEFVELAKVAARYTVGHGASEGGAEKKLRGGGIRLEAVAGENCREARQVFLQLQESNLHTNISFLIF